MVRIDELKRLSNFLRNHVKDAEFDLGTWSREATEEEKGRRHCGTVGCAIGLGATFIPEWKAQGFKLGYYNNSPWFMGSGGFNAVAAFFQFPTLDEAHRLFSVTAYPANATRHMVADRIDAYVASQAPK